VHPCLILTVAVTEAALKGRFFVEQNEQVGENAEEHRHSEGRDRLKDQPETCDHSEGTDVHRVANESVRPYSYELAGSVERRRRAPARNRERRNRGQGKQATQGK
jgi:hypothetical protein